MEIGHMNQLGARHANPAAQRRAARVAKGYSLEDLAIATGLTIAEIVSAEENDNTPVPEHHAERIEHALK
jgi:transcriptional regulator with XRE-family HTH domain